MRTWELLVLGVVMTVGTPGWAMGSNDAASDAIAVRQARRGVETSRLAMSGPPMNDGAVTAQRAGPVGATDGAVESLAARSQGGQRISFSPVAARENRVSSTTSAETMSPLGASDAARDTFAARLHTAEESRPGPRVVARDRRTTEPGPPVEQHGSGAGEP